jgi:hypothetical protein
MLDSKFFFTLVGLFVAVFAICNTNMSPAISEGFWGNPSRVLKVFREVHPGGAHTCGKKQGYALQNNYQAILGNKCNNCPGMSVNEGNYQPILGNESYNYQSMKGKDRGNYNDSMLGNDKFYQQPNFQGLLSPRFSNTQYGSNITYNMPKNDNLAVPCHPLGMADMAKEGYTPDNGCSKGRCGGGCGAGCGVAKCGKGGVSLDGNGSMNSYNNISSDDNYINAMNQVYDKKANVITDGLLAVGDMTTINSDGQVDMPLIYDRMVFANRQSRTRSQGDPIRGDLTICPDGGNWFSVHPHPAIDLQEGAMNVMGGVSNETSRALGELMNTTTAGYHTTHAGVDMTNQYATTLGAGMGDVNVKAYL